MELILFERLFFIKSLVMDPFKDELKYLKTEVKRLTNELERREEKLQEQKVLLSQYWDTIQSMRIINRIKRVLGLNQFQVWKNKIYINGVRLFKRKNLTHEVICIKIPPKNWLESIYWGDYYFARSLRKSLVKVGYKVIVQVEDEWYSNFDSSHINLVLRGPKKYRVRQSRMNIMWNISHPYDITLSEYEEYDHVFIASEYYVEKIVDKLSVTVSPLMQCSDTSVFYPVSGRRDKNIVFIGNSHGAVRPVVEKANSSGHKLNIYGKDWEGLINSSLIKGSFIRNRDLRFFYAKSGLVLNDHWEVMRVEGFVSNRVFDVLACNGRIVSDNVTGIPRDIARFIRTYDTANDLNVCIKQELNNSDNTDSSIVIKRAHSFNNRAEAIHLVIQLIIKNGEQNIR